MKNIEIYIPWNPLEQFPESLTKEFPEIFSKIPWNL